jgi:transcriptional regulator with XRE-family HTH domain
MTETAQLIATLKQQLKIQGLTYRDVARALKLSEPSVKRLFASGRFSISRLVQVSNMLGYTLAELSREALAAQPRLSTLTDKQEQEIVSDAKLLIIAVCALNNWSLEEIVATYKVNHAECVKYLLRLDKMRIIDLLPGNRIRINLSRDFQWLPFGPIKQYFQGNELNDFMNSNFAHESEILAFVNGMFTEQAAAQILDELLRLRKKFTDLHEQSLSAPLSGRRSISLLLALRRWEPTDFVKMRR